MLVMPACDSSLMRLLGSAVKTSASHDDILLCGRKAGQFPGFSSYTVSTVDDS